MKKTTYDTNKITNNTALVSCDIIRDLIPSCIDNIASDDSQKLVASHLASCTKCQEYHTRMNMTGLSDALADVSADASADLISNESSTDESQHLDYLKKLRKSLAIKSCIWFFLIISVIVIFSTYTKSNYQPNLFFVLVPILMICNYGLFSIINFNSSSYQKRYRIIITNIISSILTIYCILLMVYFSVHWVESKVFPFNMEPSQLGSFIYYQLLTLMIVEIIIWIHEILCYIKKSRYSVSVSSLCIIGFCMALYYMQLTKTLSAFEEFETLCKISILIYAEGLLTLLAIFIITRARRKK